MITIFLIIHLMLAISMVVVVLLQRSEGGALGMGGGGGGGGGLMTARGSGNVLSMITAWLAGLFMATSIVLAILAGGASKPASIMDRPATSAPAPTPAAPAKPAAPSVPLAK